MKRSGSLISRFRKDESGAFAIMFGLMAIVLVALTGAVVDYTSLEEKRNRAQIALDAAALALQPRIYIDTPDTIRTAAQALVAERLGTNSVSSWVDDIDISLTDGTLALTGGIRVPMSFVRLVGINEMEARIFAEVTRQKLSLEVVMVLDNSTSMAQESRMTHLKNAAGCAARTLFYDEVDANCQPVAGARQVEDVRIGIVPFAMYVNVGADLDDSYWLDWTGLAPVSRDNFDLVNGGVDRRALFANLKRSNGRSQSWGGCVVARQYPLDTNDTPPATGTPPANPETLFTPLFVPDVRDGVTGTYISDTPSSCPVMTCTHRRVENNCSQDRRGNWSCTGSTQNSYTLREGSSTTYPASSCIMPGYPQLSGGSRSCRGSTCTTETVYSRLSALQLQTRICKYNVSNYNNNSNNSGPNAMCPTSPILPLSDDPVSVGNHIRDMVAESATNIHEGTAWGMRVLSPEEPFTEGAPYDEATSKVLIVMTDGENTAYPANNMNWATYYSAYGFPTNNRLGESGWSADQLHEEMDRRTTETCNTAKQLGMTIYTIGLSVERTSRPDLVRQMLTDCATSADYAYFPTRASDLNEVFASIAQQLAALRISR